METPFYLHPVGLLCFLSSFFRLEVRALAHAHTLSWPFGREGKRATAVSAWCAGCCFERGGLVSCLMMMLVLSAGSKVSEPKAAARGPRSVAIEPRAIGKGKGVVALVLWAVAGGRRLPRREALGQWNRQVNPERSYHMCHDEESCAGRPGFWRSESRRGQGEGCDACEWSGPSRLTSVAFATVGFSPSGCADRV
jgi:hypothetical protein